MVYNLQKEVDKIKYKRLLNGAASISSIGNDRSKTPKIEWRLAEIIFCKTFNAQDKGSSDISVDCVKNFKGVGIKTFQGSSLQKIAEFNNKKKFPFNNSKNSIDIAKDVSSYRNYRLEKDQNLLNLNELTYHFTHRKNDNTISIHEQEMSKIDDNRICILKSNHSHIIKFTDKINNYSFNTTKSTLYKHFDLGNPLESFKYEYSKHDIDFLLNLYKKPSKKAIDEVILPLYSERTGNVGLKSGLNGWNAAGRLRHPDEIYLPISSRVHRDSPNFFPKRDEPFSLVTNDGKNKFLSKMCQDGSKALTSNPNRALGEWILRNKLNLSYGTIVTRDILEKKNFTHFKISKFDNENFTIDLVRG